MLFLGADVGGDRLEKVDQHLLSSCFLPALYLFQCFDELEIFRRSLDTQVRFCLEVTQFYSILKNCAADF